MQSFVPVKLKYIADNFKFYKRNVYYNYVFVDKKNIEIIPFFVEIEQ